MDIFPTRSCLPLVWSLPSVRKLVLLPLRLAVGWGLSPRLLGLIGMTMLVLLRLSVGWHFYTEGMEKYTSGNWTAKPFFANAKGPFAEHFRGLVWDNEGKIRLDRERVDQEWKWQWALISDHYKFDGKQKSPSPRRLQKCVTAI
ncbi:hypothetical protein [Novipirellula maiorica]|uniref:hypothetical protein n=1 Tax=Novipirellula maiorica TaxID=1265734 RepID=UPI001F3BE4F6|nr:hypothetical protein [Rhodopirellula maiorica]